MKHGFSVKQYFLLIVNLPWLNKDYSFIHSLLLFYSRLGFRAPSFAMFFSAARRTREEKGAARSLAVVTFGIT